MGKGNGIGHQLRRLVSGIAEHHTLISCADGVQLGVVHAGFSGLQSFVNPHGDIRGLLIQSHHDGTDIAVEARLCIIVTDLVHGPAHNGRYVQICSGGNLPSHQNEARAAGRLAGHPAHGILLHACIQNRIRHCIAELIRMSLRHRLRSKQMFLHHFSSS